MCECVCVWLRFVVLCCVLNAYVHCTHTTHTRRSLLGFTSAPVTRVNSRDPVHGRGGGESVTRSLSCVRLR
jgi:hypothetical protein